MCTRQQWAPSPVTLSGGDPIALSDLDSWSASQREPEQADSAALPAANRRRDDVAVTVDP